MSGRDLIDLSLVREVVESGIERYLASRRTRIPAFVEATFGWRGALEINRKALGLDIARAPVNVALAGPAVALKGSAFLARRAGAKGIATYLETRNLFLKTDVEREIEWRLHRDLFELPYAEAGTGRTTTRDALLETILADPRLDAAWAPALRAIWRSAHEERLLRSLREALDTYDTTRVAAGEIASLGLSLAAGAALAQQVTPGLMSLGPAAAQAIAAHIAIAQFPLGAGLAKVWYAFAPLPPALAFSLASAAGVLAAISIVAAFSGMLTDPLQARVGLHGRRLSRLVDTLEKTLKGDNDARYVVRDHYVARVADLIDAAAAFWVHAR